MKAVYFAWVRERVGKSEEDLAPPAHVATVGALLEWLRGQGENYAYAFDKPSVIRVALDRTHVKHDALISGAREIAFFPPMTGG
jgi:molybdopterin synthase sulfur carrier subunit